MDKDAYKNAVLAAETFPEALTAGAWAYQKLATEPLRKFCRLLGSEKPVSLPIEAFKAGPVLAGESHWEVVFESSRTTGAEPSRHYVKDPAWYDAIALKGFRYFFPPKKYRILALLPSYLERGNSSLVHMVQTWMQSFGLEGSGFFLHDLEALRASAGEARATNQPVLLIGVSFALLELAARGPGPYAPDTLVIETGGMKGRGKELTRKALHDALREGLGVADIYSEYGMTELLSQAYAGPDGKFRCAPSLRAWVSDIHLDDLPAEPGTTGRLHLIDLANIDSCCFIATDDLARMHPDGTFEVLGRLDTAELRGCNLMYM